MTDTNTPKSPIVPEGKHGIDNLTAGELGHGSTMLRTDLAAAAQTGHEKAWEARAILAWLWERRTNPSAQLAPWRELDGVDLMETLRLVAPAQTPAEAEAAKAEADQDPTDRSSALD
jgi:hypothetical protein